MAIPGLHCEEGTRGIWSNTNMLVPEFKYDLTVFSIPSYIINNLFQPHIQDCSWEGGAEGTNGVVTPPWLLLLALVCSGWAVGSAATPPGRGAKQSRNAGGFLGALCTQLGFTDNWATQKYFEAT